MLGTLSQGVLSSDLLASTRVLRRFWAEQDSEREYCLERCSALVTFFHRSSDWVIRQWMAVTPDSDQDTAAVGDSADSSA